METGFTVAVKYSKREVRFCGFWESQLEAQEHARRLRESWERSATRLKPSSIRVREIDEGQFWLNQALHEPRFTKQAKKYATI